MYAIARLAGALAAPLLLAAPAAAATVTRTFDVTVVGFQDVLSGQPVPVDPVIASFTVTYDPDVAVANTTDGLVVHGLNITYDGFLAFSYAPGASQDVFQLGAITGAGDNVSTFLGDADDLYVTFSEASGSFTVAGVYHRLATPDSTWLSETGKVEATTTAVPEPATWALLILGFGACGAVLRRRQRGVRA